MVDVVPTKPTTEGLVVDKVVCVFLLYIIFSKVVFFGYEKNYKGIFVNITILYRSTF